VCDAYCKYPIQDPNHRILAAQRSRFTHYYFYLRDEVLGPMVMRVALAVDDPAQLQAAADGLSAQIVRQRLDYWTLLLEPKFSAKERRQMNLHRF